MIALIYAPLHTDGMNQLQKNIIFLMERDGHNPNSLAAAARTKQPNIFRIVEGQSENPHDSTIAPLAAYWGVPVADLRYKDLTGGTLVARQIPDEYYNAEIQGEVEGRRYVAVVGTGQGGADGYISIDDYPPGQGDGELLSNSKDKEAYAIRVRGDSMRPRIRSGEFVIAEPSFEAQPGQDVVVRLKNGKAMVKELLFIADDEIRLGSVNDDVPPITIAREHIEYIHRIGAIVPRASAILRKPKGK